ncbi:MAG: DUF3077 domain-containing protein [Burkholderiaceae bacterium]|nr:DUF3077 domain-containing protein [Burkholderiaceae bacterium]
MHRATDAEALTAEKPFFGCAAIQGGMYRFAEGVPVKDALEHASVQLAAAYSIIDPDGLDGDGAWAVSFLVESAKAAIDAAARGLARHDRANRERSAT